MFGCAYASSHIDAYLFQETPAYKRLIRSVIAIVLVVMLYSLIRMIPVDNYITEFFFTKAIPNLVIAYVLFGYYPLTWEYIHLVDYEEIESSLR